jgi:hypothetical protein
VLRRSTLVTLLLTVPVVAWGTGFGGGDTPSRIPVAAKPYGATIEDLGGVMVEVTNLTFDGEVTLGGRVGEGLVAIPFSKIAEVRIEPSSDEDVRIAFVKLLDGSSVSVRIDHDLPCFGATNYGNYKIEVRGIRRVQFNHPPPPAP